MSRYLLIYNDNKIIYMGLEDQIEEVLISPGCKFETFTNIAQLDKRIEEVTQEILDRTDDPELDYKHLYLLAEELTATATRLSNNYYHILDLGEDAKDFKDDIETAARTIKRVLEDFCLLD